MKLSKVTTLFKWRILLVFIFVLGGYISKGYASMLYKFKDFPMTGGWENVTISVDSNVSITASIYSSILSIQSTGPICDIAICILNNQGEIVLQKQVVAGNSAYIVLSIDHLPIGDYQLELTNPFGGYLSGSFYKN